MKRVASALLGFLLCAAASGCLTVADDEGPIISIELYWDDKPETDAFLGGTCESAGVNTIDWTLTLNRNGKESIAAERKDADCTDAIDVVEPEIGEYTLEISGRSKDGEIEWSAKCPPVTALRFDADYECNIKASAEQPE